MNPEEQLRITNETLYKHSHELAVKNKALSFLGKLYEIGVLTLTQKQLAEQVAFALQAEFDFEIVGIYQYTYGSIDLLPFVAVVSDRVKAISPVSFNELSFTDIGKNTFLSAIIGRKSMHYSEHMESVWNQPELLDICRKIEEEKYVRSSIGYPLIVDDKVIGVILISMNRTYGDLTEYERETVKTFTNVISITLNRVMLYEELNLANQRQESLIHFITHEVKGYLTKSKAMFAAIVEGDFPGVSDALRDVARQALADTQKGVETVRDLLDSSNLKKGTTEYIKDTFNMKVAAEETMKDFIGIAEKKHLTLTFHSSEGDFTYVGDEAKIKRHVIRNLIDNAIRYTPAGSITVTLSKSTDGITFAVQDTGVGIGSDDMKKLFTEGGKGKDSIRINVDSTGYGLYIAKVVAEAHKGTVRVTSDGPGKGSLFTVVFPL